MMLSHQLARELGFEGNESASVDPEIKALFEEPVPVVEEAPAPVEPAEQYTYTTDAGDVKTFPDEASYLRYKIGADGNRWSEKLRDLEAKMEQRAEAPTQNQAQPAKPQDLLFEEAVLNNEEWKPVVDVMTKAFEKFYALQSNELNGKFDALNNQFGELKVSATESAVRSEFGIDRATEQQILDKQPQVVRDGLASLDPAARLAVIRQLKGPEAAAQAPPTIPRAVPPQQAHVESSARGEPDRDRARAMEEALFKLEDKDQLSSLGALFAKSGMFK